MVEERSTISNDDESAEPRLLVAGIGASAGGLEALGEFFANVPIDGMAFIVVQHLSPDRESNLTQLLGRTTRMRVVTAEEGTSLEPDHVYVIPPNADLAVTRGAIHLVPPSAARGARLPIDYLFRSLARDFGAGAIGIVLSGTGSDGTLGLQAIKAGGGFTFAQDPSTAKYDGMPRSALSSGAADFCLPPGKIGVELARIAHGRRRVRTPAPDSDPVSSTHEQLEKLFALIRAAFGNDLTQYKLATVDRRIERRMLLHKIERLDEYIRYIEEHRGELDELYKDLLISVTSFFRDPDCFEALKTKVFADLVEQKDGSRPIRVWVPGCATGEEAYSIAMCLAEVCEEKGRDTRVQIFGTDVDDDAIQIARRGVYPASVALDMSPERRERFFAKRDDELVVSRRIRDSLVFSKQNLLKDAPFSRMDLVSCRNLLIYLQPGAQKRVLRIFHYALNAGGHLLLGASETVGDAPALYAPVDRKNRIYRRKQVATPASTSSDAEFGALPQRELAKGAASASRPTLNLQGLADRRVLELYGPPGVVVNENLEILQFRGRTGPYFDPQPGNATLDVLRVARSEFHVELKKAIQEAVDQNVRVTSDVQIREHGKSGLVTLDVVPLQDPQSKARCFLVLFHREHAPTDIVTLVGGTGPDDQPSPRLVQQVQQLERELALTKEYLQSTIEEREHTLDELKSTNEELQSSNEELQSTNEELQTSKEEMESTNEELTTVNEELQNRMRELSVTNDDLHNVLSGVDNAVVIVGMDQRIRRYTTAAEKLFHLVPGDIGRSIGFLEPFLGTVSIESKVAAVTADLSTLDEDIVAANQRWYALRVSPYKTLDHAVRGALVTLTDIDVRKRAQEMTRDVGSYASKFLGAIGHPLVMLDSHLRIVWANDVFLSTFQLSSDETVGSMLSSIGAQQFGDASLRKRLDSVFESAELFRGYEMKLRLPEQGERSMQVGASLVPASRENILALMSIEPAFADRKRDGA